MGCLSRCNIMPSHDTSNTAVDRVDIGPVFLNKISLLAELHPVQVAMSSMSRWVCFCHGILPECVPTSSNDALFLPNISEPPPLCWQRPGCVSCIDTTTIF